MIFLVYIKLENSLETYSKKVGFFKRKVNEIKNKFRCLKIEKFENITLIKIDSLEKNILNKLVKYIKIRCVNQVALSENLMNNQEFFSFIKNQNVKIFDGRWLFEFLVKECAEYICFSKKEKLQYQEISFFMNKINKVKYFNILEIAPCVKVLNIITPNVEQFKKIEKRLYEENGIVLNINNNYTKSLMKSDIIFNFDFSEEEINNYEIPRRACIVNLNKEINIKSKCFEGINVSFYEIQMPVKYMKNILLKDFSDEILYESYIYKNTVPENIKNELKEDNIRINFLLGKNNKVRKNEYIKLSKKMAN